MAKESAGKSRRRGHGEGTIFQRADGRWQAQIDLGNGTGGQRKRATVYASTQKQALALLAEMRRRRDEGRPPLDSSDTVARWIAWWLDNVIDQSDLAASTKASYRAEATLHIIPALGEHRLSSLRPQHIAAWMAEMAKDAATHKKGRPSANTRRIRYATLHRSLNSAVEFDLLTRNPASPVKAPRPGRDETKVHHLSLAEAQALLLAADKHRLRAVWYVLVLMGLRRGEALGLRWSDLDLTTAGMRVEQSLGRVKGVGLVFTTPKTDTSRRACPIPLVVLEALQAHLVDQEIERAEHGGWPDNDLVFTTATGQPIEPSNLNRQFKTVCKKADLSAERLHNLRHTAATIMRVHGGADLLDVSRLLGHSSIRVTADLYGHTVPTVQQQIASRVSDLFSAPADA